MGSWLKCQVFYGQYEKLVTELRGEDVRGFRNCIRISLELCQELLEHVGPMLMKKDTLMRKALDPGYCLAIASSYMAGNDSNASLSYFPVAFNIISDLIPVMCDAIIQEYLEVVMTYSGTPG